MKEMSSVRKEVSREYHWLTQGLQKHSNKFDEKQIQMLKQTNLLYLFVKDLSPKLTAEILSSTRLRDKHATSAKLDRVSLFLMVCGWLFVVILDAVMLFYVYLFAMNQTASRQSAWFQSFLWWLFFEIIVSSTGIVLLVHILIPMYVMNDVSNVKEKILNDLILFRQKNLVIGNGRDSDQQHQRSGVERTANNSFNAAKYLFPSHRVASLFPELPVSQLILQFSTPWPRKKYGEAQEGEVSRDYDQDVLMTGLSPIVLFFLSAFFRSPHFFQDLLVQLACNTGIGYLLLWIIRMAQTNPLLLTVGLLLFLLGVFLLIKYFGKSDLEKKIQNPARVQPTPPSGLSTLPSGSSPSQTLPDLNINLPPSDNSVDWDLEFEEPYNPIDLWVDQDEIDEFHGFSSSDKGEVISSQEDKEEMENYYLEEETPSEEEKEDDDEEELDEDEDEMVIEWESS
jgi:hypothetical protein